MYHILIYYLFIAHKSTRHYIIFIFHVDDIHFKSFFLLTVYSLIYIGNYLNMTCNLYNIILYVLRTYNLLILSDSSYKILHYLHIYTLL